ncbi:AraC family transcriptional regulator N-terminal domain-containing protein [Vibrio sp. qd031]|uniref:AraC family transcriptional regulator N-terminal domain-containing protein n=1 Tax=Vibrio sp. qd031 TaxID=1603038 RepID=UPI000A10472B|nr:AraC family transcriptional regulator N-terminal domain-containing protein [Vibrio sp. qd031]
MEQTQSLRELESRFKPYMQFDGFHQTPIPEMFVYRNSRRGRPVDELYQPMAIVGLQGERVLKVAEQEYAQPLGTLFSNLSPTMVECQKNMISAEHPISCLVLLLDPDRMTKVALQLQSSRGAPSHSQSNNPNDHFAMDLDDKLWMVLLRLSWLLDDASEREVLCESLLDELYYRLLSPLPAGQLSRLLHQTKDASTMSRVVQHVTQNIEQHFTVDELASLANMGHSSFHEKFKLVMHDTPLHFIKTQKLKQARSYLWQGLSVSEAAYKVGYNNLGQFSREFKRHFGHTASHLTQ